MGMSRKGARHALSRVERVALHRKISVFGGTLLRICCRRPIGIGVEGRFQIKSQTGSVSIYIYVCWEQFLNVRRPSGANNILIDPM